MPPRITPKRSSSRNESIARGTAVVAPTACSHDVRSGASSPKRSSPSLFSCRPVSSSPSSDDESPPHTEWGTALPRTSPAITDPAVAVIHCAYDTAAPRPPLRPCLPRPRSVVPPPSPVTVSPPPALHICLRPAATPVHRSASLSSARRRRRDLRLRMTWTAHGRHAHAINNPTSNGPPEVCSAAMERLPSAPSVPLSSPSVIPTLPAGASSMAEAIKGTVTVAHPADAVVRLPSGKGALAEPAMAVGACGCVTSGSGFSA
eukprot:scaffold153559_cov30-Tisochrysis_lutea.AAC.2